MSRPETINNKPVTLQGLQDYNRQLKYEIPRMGLNNTIEGDFSYCFGAYNHVVGNFNFAQGRKNQLRGVHEVSLGELLVSEGNYILNVGYNNEIKGTHIHAIGHNLIAANDKSKPCLIIGQYNEDFSNCAFAIGNGESGERKNLFSIAYNGYINSSLLTIDIDQDWSSWIALYTPTTNAGFLLQKKSGNNRTFAELVCGPLSAYGYNTYCRLYQHSSDVKRMHLKVLDSTSQALVPLVIDGDLVVNGGFSFPKGFILPGRYETYSKNGVNEEGSYSFTPILDFTISQVDITIKAQRFNSASEATTQTMTISTDANQKTLIFDDKSSQISFNGRLSGQTVTINWFNIFGTYNFSISVKFYYKV